MEWLIFIGGALFGVLITCIRFVGFRAGRILVRTDEPGEQPYLFLELSKDVHKVLRKKVVVLEIDTKN